MRIIMEELTIRKGDDFIKLGQAVKAVGFVESGVEAKEVIQSGWSCGKTTRKKACWWRSCRIQRQ